MSESILECYECGYEVVFNDREERLMDEHFKRWHSEDWGHDNG